MPAWSTHRESAQMTLALKFGGDMTRAPAVGLCDSSILHSAFVLIKNAHPITGFPNRKSSRRHG